MIFLTRKKLEAKVAEAVEQANRDLQAELDDLRDLVTQIVADRAERETEVMHGVEQRLAEERALNEAGVQGLLAAVQAIPPPPKPIEIPDYSHQILLVTDQVESIRQGVREVEDTVNYLLEAPTTVQTVVREIETYHGVAEAVAQHSGIVRPMGAK